jgi:hypothetical protein
MAAHCKYQTERCYLDNSATIEKEKYLHSRKSILRITETVRVRIERWLGRAGTRTGGTRGYGSTLDIRNRENILQPLKRRSGSGKEGLDQGKKIRIR